MSISAVIEVTIGLAFIYLLLSLLVSSVNEWFAQVFKTRAIALEKAIKGLLKDPPDTGSGKANPNSLGERFYDHPVIKAFCEEKWEKSGSKSTIKRRPSYIPARTFAMVVFDLIFPGEDVSAKSPQVLTDMIDKANIHPDLKIALKTFVISSAAKADNLRKEVEDWFDETMGRLNGWYSRKARLISFAIGIVLAVGLNIDTMVIADSLWRDPSLRAGVTSYVESHWQEYEPAASNETGDSIAVKKFPITLPGRTAVPMSDSLRAGKRIQQLTTALAAVKLPIGGYRAHFKESVAKAERDKGSGTWGAIKFTLNWVLEHLLGWLMTAVAVSLGAPFWFDVLKKFINLRSAGLVPKTSKEEEAAVAAKKP